MKDQFEQQGIVQKAVIYCRVSSVKQRVEGSGLESQEARCRQYADMHGYEVEAVFPDDVSGSGNFMKRPGMVALLSYLDAQPDTSYIVIFDDLKRLARDREFHWVLRKELSLRDARPECLNFNFEDTPEGEFIESILAAQGQLERDQNRRQVLQKMQARIENGFWVFKAPLGYKYVPDSVHGGKKLVVDEPLASVIRTALEGFANGHFASQAEVQRFLEADPNFPKDKKDGTLRPMTVNRLLKKVVYAGYVEAPKWGISVREGKHEGLISFETHQRILDLIEGKKRRPAARKDFNEDFPLRGHVACDCCGNAMTAAWSKGKYKHYAYYVCQTRGCEMKGKSVPRANMEDGFADILKTLQPAKGLFEVAKAMLHDAWDMRLAEAKSAKEALGKQLRDAETQIEQLLDRVVNATSPSVVKRYESKIDELERQRIILEERVDKIIPPKGRLEDCIELTLKLLSSPWYIYENGSYMLRQTVLRLAFAEPLRYDRNEGYRTPTFTFPFKVLAGITDQKNEMVPPERVCGACI